MVNGIDGKGNSGEDEERIPEGDSDEWEAFRDSVKEDAETREAEEADLSPPPDDKDLPIFEEMSLGEHLGGVIGKPLEEITEKPLEEVVDDLDAKLRTVEMPVVDENYVASDKVHGYIGTLNTNNDFRLSPQDSSEIEQIIRRRFGEKEETYEKVKIQALVEEFTSNPGYIKQKLKEDIVGVIMDSKLTPKPAESEIEELVLDRYKDVLERPLSIKMLEKFVVLKSMHVYMGKAGIVRTEKEEKGILKIIAMDLPGRPVSSITNKELERNVILYAHAKEIKGQWQIGEVSDEGYWEDIFDRLDGKHYDPKEHTKIIEMSATILKSKLNEMRKRALALQQKEHGGGPMEPTQPLIPGRKQYKPQPGEKYKVKAPLKDINLKGAVPYVALTASAIALFFAILFGRGEPVSYDSKTPKKELEQIARTTADSVARRLLGPYNKTDVQKETDVKQDRQMTAIEDAVAKANKELKAVRGDVGGLRKSTTTQIGEIKKTEEDRYKETTDYRRELGERLTGMEAAQKTTSGGVENLNSLFAGFKGDGDDFQKKVYEKFASLTTGYDGLKDKLELIIEGLETSRKLRAEVPGETPENGKGIGPEPENGEVVPENGVETPGYENGETTPENGVETPGVEKKIGENDEEKTVEEEKPYMRKDGPLLFRNLIINLGSSSGESSYGNIAAKQWTKDFGFNITAGTETFQGHIGAEGYTGTISGDIEGNKNITNYTAGFTLEKIFENDAWGNSKARLQVGYLIQTRDIDGWIPIDGINVGKQGKLRGWEAKFNYDDFDIANLKGIFSATYTRGKGKVKTKVKDTLGSLIDERYIDTEHAFWQIKPGVKLASIKDSKGNVKGGLYMSLIFGGEELTEDHVKYTDDMTGGELALRFFVSDHSTVTLGYSNVFHRTRVDMEKDKFWIGKGFLTYDIYW